MEWRLYFSKTRRENFDDTQISDSDIAEIIQDRVKMMQKEFKLFVKQFKMPMHTIELAEFTPIKTPKAYGLKTS